MKKVAAGRYIDLDDKRLVFVGDLLDSDGYGVGFRNAEGEITKFALSTEAAKALVELLTNPAAGTHADHPTFLIKEEDTVYCWTATVMAVEAPPTVT